MRRQVHHHAAADDPLLGEVLDAEPARAHFVAARHGLAGRDVVVDRADHVDAAAPAIVVAALIDPVPVGVEHLSHRSEAHTAALQSPMRTSYAVFRYEKKTNAFTT